ncbi:VG15 protein [Streptomyces reniochalinae]
MSLPNALASGEVDALVKQYGQGFVARLINSGASAEEAKRLALARQLGGAVDLVLSGGRKVIDDGITRDRRCIGWRRVASGSCCSFCAMLASRGAVYKDQKSALGTRKGNGRGGRGAGVHRACQCRMEPVYSRKSKPTPNEARYERMWRESGGDPLEFRRMVEGRA